MLEEWREIPGYGGHYEASSLGKVRVKPRVVVRPHSKTGTKTEYFYAGRVLSQYVDCNGYLYVTVGVEKKTIKRSVHALVARAFYGERVGELVVCHNNGIKTDNRAENLRWDTTQENNRDKSRHGTMPHGDKHPMAKLNQGQVDHIRKVGMHYLDVVNEYGISKSQAWRITSGKSWVGLNAAHQKNESRP